MCLQCVVFDRVKATRVCDTREPHQPAPVVLPGKTMSHVTERMRLIRQGDHQEIDGFEAALMKVWYVPFYNKMCVAVWIPSWK